MNTLLRIGIKFIMNSGDFVAKKPMKLFARSIAEDQEGYNGAGL